MSLLVSTQSSFTVSWRRPAASNGLITRYDVTAEPLATIGLRSPLGGPATTTLEIQDPEVALLSTLTGLEPATTYSITLWAYTLAGRGGGTPVQLMTNESGEPAISKYRNFSPGPIKELVSHPAQSAEVCE